MVYCTESWPKCHWDMQAPLYKESGRNIRSDLSIFKGEPGHLKLKFLQVKFLNTLHVWCGWLPFLHKSINIYIFLIRVKFLSLNEYSCRASCALIIRPWPFQEFQGHVLILTFAWLSIVYNFLYFFDVII